MTTLLPIPQNFQLVNRDGFYTPEFKRYLDGLLGRVGGVKGGSLVELTEDTAVAWDLDQAPVAVLNLTGNRTLLPATNQVAGNYFPFRLIVQQDLTGGRTLSFTPGTYLFPGGTPPTLTAAPFARDEFEFTSDGTHMTLRTAALNVS